MRKAVDVVDAQEELEEEGGQVKEILEILGEKGLLDVYYKEPN